MTGSNIAVLGCGYVGTALCERLVGDGHGVIGTTTTPERVGEIRALGAEPGVIALSQTERLHALLSDREIVYLTAGAGGKKRSYCEVYLEGARNVVRAAAGTPVRRIIYTSSTAVYTQEDGAWVDEASATEPVTENGRVLIEAERCLLDGAAALDVTATAVRLSGIYGPGRDPRRRVRAHAGQTLSNGAAYVNLIHRDDVVEVLAALMGVTYHGVLNLSDDEPTPRRAYYDRLIAAAGLAPIEWVSESGTARRGKRVRNDLVKRTLGVRLRHPRHG